MLTKQYIDDHQVVERYLADQLSDAERDAFEDYYAEHPDMLRDLDAAAGIKRGVTLLRESGELTALTAPRPAPRWRVGLALAATVLIAIVAGSYWLRNDAAPVILAGDLGGLRAALPVAGSYQVQRTRSDVDAVVALPAAGQAIRLRIRPLFEPRPASYRVELLSIAPNTDERTPVGAAGQLALDGDGLVTVYVDATYLRPGNYELKVADEAATQGDAGTNEFLLEVTAGTPAPAP